ncbi:MAG TPA: DUF4136 domain-containing protein [Telluria sp.]|nr:DUF4136 domain-containing protein [Telluria sp.]
MKRLAMVFLAGMVLLLSGCATTVRSNVTAFHNWPADLPDKTYVLEAPSPQDDTLEYRAYQNLVRGELARHGFQEVSADRNPTLGVTLRFMTTVVPVRVIEVDYPHMYTSMRLGYFHPRRRGYWGGWYSPFWYDPFWYGMPDYTETIKYNYHREVQVSIKSRRDGRRLFDVTVRNQSRVESTPSIMPVLVASAFAEFPGPSGVSRVIQYKLEPNK